MKYCWKLIKIIHSPLRNKRVKSKPEATLNICLDANLPDMCVYYTWLPAL